MNLPNVTKMVTRSQAMNDALHKSHTQEIIINASGVPGAEVYKHNFCTVFDTQTQLQKTNARLEITCLYTPEHLPRLLHKRTC